MPPPHFTDDAFELYLLDLADEDLKKKIEEHLLVCDTCLHDIKKVEQNLILLRASMEGEAFDSRTKVLMARLEAGEFQLFKPFIN